MTDKTVTLNQGVEFTITDEVRRNYLFNERAPKPLPEDAETKERIQRIYEDRYVDFYGTVAAGVDSINNAPALDVPIHRSANSYFYEQEFNARNEAYKQDNIFMNAESEDESKALKSATKLALYQHLKEFSPEKATAAAQAAELNLRNIEEAIGRPLTQDEIVLYVAQNEEKQINEMLDESSSDIPLKLLANPQVQQLMGPDVTKMAIAKWQADHPAPQGFFGDFSRAWSRAQAQGNLKEEETNNALALKAADTLEQNGQTEIAGFIRDNFTKDPRTFNEIVTEMNMSDIAYGKDGGAMFTAGEVAQGIIAPYQTLPGLAALAAGGVIGKGKGFSMVNGLLNGYDYFQNNSFDIAYQAALRNESLRDNFADTIIQAAPEAAVGSLTEAVESAILTKGLGTATSKIYKKLKGNAGKNPTLAAADSKIADEIEANVTNLKSSAFKDFIKGFATAYPQALAVQGVTTATQGAITQHGINRLAGEEVQELDEAAISAVRDNLGTIAVLSLIPGGLNGLSRAISNKSTADALNEHNQRLESEAVAAASPIHKLGPDAAEMVFTLTDSSKYRFAAKDIVSKYQEMGLTPDEFRARFEKKAGDFADLEKLAETGGDIVMPKSHWEAFYAKDGATGKSDVYDFFNPFLRTEKTKLSLDELKERLTPEAFERLSNELIESINNENITNVLANHIRADITSKMQAQQIGSSVHNDYLAALTANLYRKLADATGIDGVELYNRYAPEIERKDNTLNLSGEAQGTEKIGRGGGAYSLANSKYYFDENVNLNTVVHEFGHSYLATLERIVNDAELNIDKSLIEKEIADIKQALGYKHTDAIDEQMQEKFTAALVASIVGERKNLGNETNKLYAPDNTKYNASFHKLKTMISNSLYAIYGPLKDKLEQDGTADVKGELALQEYRERFDPDFEMTPELQDFMTAHVYGQLAFNQHVQIAGLHPILDKAVLKEIDPKLAEEVDKVSSAISEESEQLKAMYTRLEQTMLTALRRGSHEYDKLKQEMIDAYFNEHNQQANLDDRLAAELDKKRKEFLKTLKLDLSSNPKIDLAAADKAEKAYNKTLDKSKESAVKEAKKQIEQEQKTVFNHFKAQEAITKFTIKARTALNTGDDIKAIERDLLDELKGIYGDDSTELKTIARQVPLFQVRLDKNGVKSLDPVQFPFSDQLIEFAAKDADGTLNYVQHRATSSSPSYSALQPDRTLIKAHFQTKLDAQYDAIAPSDAQLSRAKAAYDDAYAKALTNKSLPTIDGSTVGKHIQDMREAAADEYIMSIKDQVAKELQASAYKLKRGDGAYPDELKPVIELIDQLKALNEETPAMRRLRREAERKLERNPAWHILQYLKVLDDSDKINYDDAKRSIGLRAANRLLTNGAASKDGTVTLDSLGKDGPIRGALGDADKILERELNRAWAQLSEAQGLVSLGIKRPEKATDLNRGVAIANALASFGNKTADDVIKEQVQRNILQKSKDYVIDSLKYNKALIGLTKKAFLKVNKLERAIIDKLDTDIKRKSKSDTDIKLMSDSVINRHSLTDLSVKALTEAGGRARNKAQALATKLAEGPHIVKQISDLLTIDAVNKMAAHDAKVRADAIEKQRSQIEEFTKRGLDKTKNYDTNHVLIMRVAAARLGIISSRRGAEAERLLRHAPDEVQKLLEQIKSDGRFATDYKQLKIPQVESALATILDLKAYARALQKQRMEGDKDTYAAQSGEIITQLDKVSKPIAPYGEKDGVRSWSANPIKNFGRAATRTVNYFLTKVEQYCIRMDGTDNGPLYRNIYKPVRDAYDRAQQAKLEAQREANQLIARVAALENKGVIKTTMTDSNGKIIAFGMDGKYKGNGTMELVAFLTHIGNDSNRNKLLKGAGIDEAAFTDWFVKAQDEGIITKDILDAVQAYWDYNEKYWPALQEAYYKSSGKYVTEVKPREFVTKFGTYRGGYAPAIRDADMTTGPLDVTGDIDKLINGNALGEFFGEASFMKERSEGFTQQLRLDLGAQLSNTVNVIHYSHMLDPVTRVYRMINDGQNNLKEALNSRSPDFVDDVITKWLSRALRDSSANAPVSNMFARYLSTLTNRIGLSYMFGNVSNAVQGLTNFIVAAAHIKPGYIVSSMARYCYDFGNMRNTMIELSPHMKMRFEANIDKSVDEVMQLTLSNNAANTLYIKGQQFMSHHGYFLQTFIQHGIDTIIWHAAFEEGIARKMSDADAIAYADSSIRLTQGSQDVIDLNNVEAGPPVLKMFTQFTSYFNTLLQLIRVNMRRNLGDDPSRIARASRAAYVLSTAMIIPAILSDWIAEAFKGNNVFTESEDWEDFAFNHAMVPTLKMGSAMVPVFGNSINLISAQLTGAQAFGGLIGTPATIGAIDSTLKLVRATWNGQEPNSPWKDGLTVLGMLTGIPAGTAIGRRIDFATNNDVDSFTEALRLICSGDLSNEEKERN